MKKNMEIELEALGLFKARYRVDDKESEGKEH